MDPKVITLFGGSGFLGRHVVNRLARQGFVLRIAVRDPQQAMFLKPLGPSGNIIPMHCDILSRKSIENALEGSDIAINLVGILYEKGRYSYDAVHHQAPKMIAETVLQKKLQKFIHVSALGIDHALDCSYAQTKLAGEQAARQIFNCTTLIRPSLMFGPEDNFFNRFAAISRYFPFLPLFYKGETRFQPVYVQDVAKAIEYIVLHAKCQGKIYELGGPTTHTFKELLDIMGELIHKNLSYVNLPEPLAHLMAFFTEMLPGEPLITRDQLRFLKYSSVVNPNALQLKDLKITAQSLSLILPTYLRRYAVKY
jgi:uncharacterized protein YbjT (DUF2867 family)